MKNKVSFSPWHTKDESFDEEDESLVILDHNLLFKKKNQP